MSLFDQIVAMMVKIPPPIVVIALVIIGMKLSIDLDIKLRQMKRQRLIRKIEDLGCEVKWIGKPDDGSCPWMRDRK